MMHGRKNIKKVSEGIII